MAGKPKPTQDEPTKPRPVDDNGRELDQWRLPVNGPARLAALADMKKRDPQFHPEDWDSEATPPPPPPSED